MIGNETVKIKGMGMGLTFLETVAMVVRPVTISRSKMIGLLSQTNVYPDIC